MSRAGGSRAGRDNPKTPRTGRSNQSQAESGLSDLSEDFTDEGETETATELSTVVPRASYVPPPGYHSRSLARFKEYLEDTQVQVLFRKLLHVLLNRPELPYNPYPGFYMRLRVHQERFHLEKKTNEEILSKLKNPLQDTYIQNLYMVKNYRDLWGLSSILRVINPAALEKYRWLVNSVTPRLGDLPSLEDYSNQVMVALIGPCVFDGSFYLGAHSVQLRLEYLITGPDVSQGISIFVNSLMQEIDEMYQSEHHFLQGVYVPVASNANPDMWVKQFYDRSRLQSDKETLLQKMSDAVIGNRYILLDCIFMLDPNYPSYVKGEKQYGFNFIEIVEDLREEGLSSFCEYPMASLHEGVFFERSQAEAYMSIFQVQLDDFESGEAIEAGVGDPPRSPGIVSMGAGVSGSQAQLRAGTAGNQPFSKSQEGDVSNIQKHVHGRLGQIRPRRVKIDGFRFGDERATGAFAWQITTPIKANYQRKIAGYRRTVDLFEVVYAVLMLVILDREAFGDDILVEIYRLLHGTAGRLYMLLEHNKALRSVIQAVSNTDDFPVIAPLLVKYLDEVKSMFLHPMVERSQDYHTIGRSICAKVEDMIYAPDMEFAAPTHLQFTLRGLKNINLYLIPLLMELAEDSLGRSPEITRHIDTMEDTFPEEDPRPPTRYKTRNTATFQAGEQEIPDDIIKHGMEDEHIKRHETSVLNMRTCIMKDLSPPAMAKESVLMKYMLDCHFDEMWSDYLIDLAGGDVLPPNPFPRLITTLRQCTMKMDLFFDKSSTVTEKMFNLEVKMEDQENYVFHVPGLEAHGTITSLMLIDTGTYVLLTPIIQNFQQRSYIQKKGPYRVGICLALSGPSIWYGRMQPYLNEIELHEHYYIQGPSGCQGEAMQLCAVIVHSHMVDMITRSGLPVMGVYFGSPAPDHWSSDDVLGKKTGFLTQFVTMCKRKQPIYAKAYVIMDRWRYVTLTKYFKLHFLEDGTRSQTFFPDNPASFYQSIFLTKERAAFHYQNSGPPHGGDPMSIANVRAVTGSIEKNMFDYQRKGDWLNFYRHMLLRDLISQDQARIADCWRILHCMASQLEYVTCMMEVLQDLVLTCLLSGLKEARREPTRQNTRGSSRQSTQSNSKYKNPVDHKILTKMVIAFYQKLMYVCEARLTMAAKSLTEFIETKLKSALEFDPDTGQPFLAIEDQTMFRLEEMKSILKIFQDTLSGDTRSVCQEVTMKYKPHRLRTPQMVKPPPTQRASATGQGTSRGLMKPDPYLSEPDMYKPPTRPTSVASSILDDPDFYRKKSGNMMTIAE